MCNRAKLFNWVTFILFAMCSAALCSAQMADNDKASAQSVTGCLQKGGEEGGFTLLADNGKVWELHSKKVALAEHVGHTVTVAGSATNESKTDEQKIAANEKKEYGEKEHGDLQVHSLKMVSDSCK